MFASNTVGHMLSGKAVQRAFRGHLLVENALNAVLTADDFNLSLPKACSAKNYEEGELVKDRRQTVPVLDSVVVERDVLNVADTEPGKLSDPRQTVPVPDSVVVECDVRYVEDTEAVKRGEPRQTVPVPEKVVMESDVLNVEETEPVKGKDPSQKVPAPDSVVIQGEVPDLIHKAVELCERLMDGDIGIAEIYSDSLLDTAKERVDIKKKELANHPTARLWLQYMDMVALLRQLKQNVRGIGNCTCSLSKTCFLFMPLPGLIYTPNLYTYICNRCLSLTQNMQTS